MPRKAFLLRIDDQLLLALQRLADRDLRSLNGEIEFLLREALKGYGSLPPQLSAEDDRPHSDDGGKDSS